MPAEIQKNERQPYRLEVEPPSVRAFTLIEVMVVVAIIGIMATLVVMSLGNGRVTRELETNAREFASVVREAQNYALTGKQIDGNTACTFSVTWAAPASYSLGYTPSGNCFAAPTTIVSYSLKNGVNFNNSGSFNFALPHANTSIPSGTVAPTILTKASLSHVICTSSDGRISDQPGATCP